MNDDFIDWLYEQARLYHCENYQFCLNCPFYAIEVDSCAEMTADQKREILMKIYESEVNKWH
jgi:predicted metal-binding protein